MTSTPAASKPVDLSEAVQAIYASLFVIYMEFEILFKLVGLFFLAYVCFKIGKMSVSEPVAEKGRKISLLIQQVEKERGDIPKSINEITQKYQKFIISSLILIAAAVGLVMTKNLQVKLIYLALTAAVPLTLYLVMSVKRNLLRNKLKKLPEEEKKIRDDTRSLIEQLGPKVKNSLKTMLCRDKYLAKQREPANVCSKQKCQQLRSVLQKRYESIRVLAESALTFEWCLTCRKRNVFDELLRFETKPMQEKFENEEVEVQARLRYMLECLDDMLKWLQEAAPCNCSKLYMEEILRNKKIFSAVKKQTNPVLESLQRVQAK